MADLIMTISNGRGPQGPAGADAVIPTPTNGGTFTGPLALNNINGTYLDDYNLATSGTITFVAAASPVLWGFDYVRIVSDGTTPFASEANLNAIFNHQYGVPDNYILEAGTHEFYIWKTPSGTTMNIPGKVADVVVDVTNPIITLIGANPYPLTVGDTYTEPGATATDNIDGDISGDIVISGTVDTGTEGIYPITYNVQDAAGNNATEVTRNVVVSATADATPPAKMTLTNVVISGTGTFTADLNGGDDVTADNDLTYKIYGSADGYTTAIKTTGSHTSDSDVTVTSGSVVISNVTVGSETKFKIAAVDEAGNESTPSAIFDAVSTSEFPNFTFDGVVIDSSEWTVVNPDPSDASITQNGEISVKKLTATALTARANRIESVRQFSSGTFEFDLRIGPSTPSGNGFVLYNSDSNYGGIISPGSGDSGKIRVYLTGGTSVIVEETYDNAKIRFRIVYNGSTMAFSYNKAGAGWVTIGTYAAVFGDVKIMCYTAIGATEAYLDFDNLDITSYTEV